MASLDCDPKAEASRVLPSLILLTYLNQKAILSITTIKFDDSANFKSGSKVQLTLEEGRILDEQEILDYVLAADGRNIGPQALAGLEEWIYRARAFSDPNYRAVRGPLEELENHLTLRSYIVGYDLNISDLSVWATIRSNGAALSAIKNNAGNALRWYNFVEASNPWIADAVKSFIENAVSERAAIASRGASYDIDLPSFEGPMTTRFPPEPSGYLHIGHAKAALLNDYFAHHNGQKGTLLCRFDDTNPSKESMEFQDSIIEDLALMKIYPDKVSYSSDYFQQMYELAVKLIKDGKAFAEDSELGQDNEERKNRLPSKRRNMDITETLARFEEMKTGSSNKWCLRARIAYDSPNGSMRDPVIYRCSQTPHHRTGTSWKIYPTYDFCAPILDAIEGVTLALRTNEYRDRNVQYEWMQEALGLRKVPIWDFSRFNLIRTVLSKRKLTKIVDEGLVWGWDDPRMPTIRGIIRRGVTVEALREFILKQGPSKNVLNLEWGAFWATNKKVIDPIAVRHTAIAEKNAVYCHVSGISGSHTEQKPKHAKNASLGTKTVMYSETIVIEQEDAQSFALDQEITLMNWGNAFVRQINTNAVTGLIESIKFELHLEGNFKKTKKITWLASVKENLVPVTLYFFDYLITKDKLEKDKDRLEDFLNPNTVQKVDAFADVDVGKMAVGTIMQFDRKGFFKLDQGNSSKEGTRMVFFDVPSGRS